MENFKNYIKEYEANVNIHLEEIIAWTKEAFGKTGANGVILGMSGGIDCSVTARIFQEAGIPVKLVLMPYGESMELENDDTDAMELINKFNFDYTEFDITDSVDSIVDGLDEIMFTNRNNSKSVNCLKSVFTLNKSVESVELSEMAVSNVKPRVRMTALYTLAQSLNYIVAGTGNKSERLMGYFTKWGDGANDLNIIGNLTKTEVRILGKELNLPERIITKAPSANLWKGQTDEDEMGITYERLDAYILFKEATEEDKVLVETAMAKSSHKLKPIPMF